MNTFVNFANPNQGTTNKAVTLAYPETGQKPDITTLAVGEEGGGQATTKALGEEGGGTVTSMSMGEEGGGTVTTQALGEEGGGGATTKAVGEEGGGHATTLAVGEEGGEPPVPRPPINDSNGFDQATRDYIGFFRDANTQQGRVAGDGNLTRTQASNQLNTYAQQLQTLKTLQLFMEALDLGSNNRVQTLFDQISNRYEAGNKLVSFFNLFAGKTGPTDTVQASDINTVAFRDGERQNVSVLDLLLSKLY